MLILFLAMSSHLYAANNEFSAEGAYRLGEKDARDQLEEFAKAALIERSRKAKAGDPPSSERTVREAQSGVKFLIYNRAASAGICAAKMMENGKPADATWEKFKECVEKRNGAMLKFMKLGDYSSLPGHRSSANCELKGRDFESERRFPPFKFLQDGLGPAILDFDVVNDCLLTGR